MENVRDYIEEKALNNQSKSIPIDSLKILIELTEKRICKIELKDGGFGTGFFCVIPYLNSWKTYNTLITNNHVIGKQDLLPGEIIKFSINNEKKFLEIKIDDSRLVYSNEDEDISIIELKPEDGLSKDAFFEVDNKIFEKNFNEIFLKQPVFLLHYPKGKQMNFADGLIININEDNYSFGHLCDSSEGSSGGPIINATTFQVIGAHKGGALRARNYNVGIFMNNPIKNFNKIINGKSLVSENNNKNINDNEDTNINNNNDEKKNNESIIKNEDISINNNNNEKKLMKV